MSHRKRTKNRRRRFRDGCGYLFFACFVSCLMLLFNGVFVIAVYSSFAGQTPGFVDQMRIGQAIMVVLPVLLVFVEWRIIDWVADVFLARPD